jgi:hypothetical protein
MKVTLLETSIHDLLVCIETMADYDRFLSRCGVI